LGDPRAELRAHASRAWRRALLGIAALVSTTVISGAFVAGLRAGKIFNTFPLMGGSVVPPGYGQLSPWWRNAFENPAAAQFDHRLLAIVTALVVLGAAWRASRATTETLPVRAQRSVRILAVVVLVQVALGVVTLLFAVPVTLGALHQLVGVAAFSWALLALRRA
jgi:cytochrome c oxidase assembly protein subunit 15